MSWISADEALALLGTKPQTLYANVSRGRISARPDPEDPRRSQYRHEDVERLAARQRGRRAAKTVAAESIAWGEPVLPTALSTVEGGQLFYRTANAAELATKAGLEEVAALLWDVDAPVAFDGFAGRNEPGLLAAYRMVAELAATQMPAFGRSRPVLLRDCVLVVSMIAAALAGPSLGPVHERLARHWQRPQAADAIRTALVLLAEHELNASTFAARVTASTGAPFAASVMAGLAALSGPLHGNASHAMAGLVQEARRLGAEAAIAALLRRGQALPCFGHRLYPDGDIRAPALLGSFDVPPLFVDLAAAGEALSGEKPNVDFALTALAAAYGLPADAPLQLFALARSVGWLAHALEQIESGTLIRPRARYVGAAPTI